MLLLLLYLIKEFLFFSFPLIILSILFSEKSKVCLWLKVEEIWLTWLLLFWYDDFNPEILFFCLKWFKPIKLWDEFKFSSKLKVIKSSPKGNFGLNFEKDSSSFILLFFIFSISSNF